MLLPSPAPFVGTPFSLAADIVPGSALDVSFLLPKPAGKRGFVRTRGETMRFGDGSPAAFWGVNLCWDSLYPSPAEGEKVARRLAMSGVNLVRLTYLDGGPHGLFRQYRDDSETPDADRIARLDQFGAALTRSGVYRLVVLGMGRTSLKPGDGVPFETDKARAEAAYALGRFFDPRIQQSDQRVWRTILTHRNAETGLRNADDPAVVAIEILNEGSLFYRYDRFAYLPSGLTARIAIRWNRWLAARYGSRVGFAQAWGRDIKPGEDPTVGTVALDFSYLDGGPKGASAAPPRRGADWNRFLAEVSRDYYQAQIAFLRGLGVRQPISCNGGASYSAADRWSNRDGDLFDQHQYFDHPNWSPSLTYTNRSLLQSGMGMVTALARGRIADKPFGVTEYDFCYPNDWRAEGWVPFAAYARLQGWNFATAFAYNAESWDNREAAYGPTGKISGVWRFHNDPASFGQWPLTALIFLRGDVRPGQKTVDIGFTDADTFAPEPGRFPPDAVGFIGDLPLVHRTRQVYGQDGKRFSGVPSGRAEAATRKSATAQAASLLPPLIDGWRCSDTSEIRYRAASGTFVIDTPRTQGIVGFPETTPIAMRDITITAASPFGSMVVTSLDGLPLSRSRRMLLTAVGRCRNTNFALTPAPGAGERYQLNQTNAGNAPILIEPLRLTLAFRHEHENQNLTVFALDGAGNRIVALPVASANGRAIVTIMGNPATIYYEVVRL